MGHYDKQREARDDEAKKDFQAFIDRKRAARMAKVDALPQDVREVVHDWGLSIVDAFWDIGVRKGKQMRHIIETVLNETRAPQGGTFSSQGIKTRRIDRKSVV